jgi:hypothetical protein
MVYADGSNPSVRKDIGVRLPSPARNFLLPADFLLMSGPDSHPPVPADFEDFLVSAVVLLADGPGQPSALAGSGSRQAHPRPGPSARRTTALYGIAGPSTPLPVMQQGTSSVTVSRSTASNPHPCYRVAFHARTPTHSERLHGLKTSSPVGEEWAASTTNSTGRRASVESARSRLDE